MRGTPGGETPVSQAATDDYREGHDRVFGERKPGQRGRWIFDPDLGKLVRADEYEPEKRAIDGAIMVDRFYEGQKATDGTDIGSRRKHRDYMRVNNLTTADDFSPSYYEGLKRTREREAKKQRREAIARRLYEMDKP